jgi:hypothetical protein
MVAGDRRERSLRAIELAWHHQSDADVPAVDARDDAPDLGASVRLDGEEARTGAKRPEHVVGIEQHAAIERETTAADTPG